MKRIYWLSALLVLTFLPATAQDVLDLSGKWSFQIDRTDVGVSEKWFQRVLNDSMNLPGSMPEKLKGDKVSVKTDWTGSLYDSSYYYNPKMAPYRVEGNVKFPFFLTPERHYVGVAWYQKEVLIPSSWNGKRVILSLERPHIMTTLWVDNKEIGSCNSFSVPHVYDLTAFLSKGKHTLSVRIDNALREEYNVGKDSHSITDQTQGNWNGIVGKMTLTAGESNYLEDVQVYPNIRSKKAVVKISVTAEKAGKGTITLSAEAFNGATQKVPATSKEVTLVKGENKIEMDLAMGEEVHLWDEFTPVLYKLKTQLTVGKGTDSRETTFGMREFTIEGKWFYVNGRKTMLRGTVENCCFPLTGYAPMNVDAWMRVFRICRSYGLNHMRFHSFCPPEAAFMAADRIGFYLQPEGPSWPNHGSSLGSGRPIDTYLMQETQRISKEYGNYASFCMLACGNEPSGRWVEWVSKFVDYWKATDTRRVYTGASVGGSWAWQPKSQYHVKAGARGLDWNGKAPETMSDFRGKIDTVSQPYVSHETGQWCAFPDFTEIRKYTGVNKALNFEIFRDLLRDNKMEELGHDFMMASGKLQALCYKYEIEKTLRTPDYAGFQLLCLNDYSGQGTALVGVLNVFWEEKGYIDAPAFHRFCSPTVPLARIAKFTYSNNETFKASLEMSHFGQKPLQNVTVIATIRDANGMVLSLVPFTNKQFEIGNCQSFGDISFPLQKIEKAQKLNLEVKIAGTDILNDWDFWVYPETLNLESSGIYQCDSLDQKAIGILEKGGNVLITAAGKISYGKEIQQQFTPVFWNTSWFKMRPPHTTGIYVNNYHPVFHNFPTEYHSNLQWWELVNKAQVMQFDKFPDEFQPLVQSIDTWFISRKAGILFEAKVLNGKVMMSSMDLTSKWESRLAARQLYASILEYMRSDQFRPQITVQPEMIRDLYTEKASVFDMYTRDAPDELKTRVSRRQ
ncbi:MAG TPA: sugar-binding domain-containing protein [Bacteroidales bacterium]